MSSSKPLKKTIKEMVERLSDNKVFEHLFLSLYNVLFQSINEERPLAILKYFFSLMLKQNNFCLQVK